MRRRGDRKSSTLLRARGLRVRPSALLHMGNSCAPPPARSWKRTLGCVPSGVLEALRDDTAAFGKLGHDFFVQPDIHLGRAVEAAFVPELLGKLLAGGET